MKETKAHGHVQFTRWFLFLQGSLRQEEKEKRMKKENINQMMNYIFYIFPIFKA